MASREQVHTVSIHPTAVVSPHATLGSNVQVGPFCVVEQDCQIGDDCRLEARSVVKQGTRLGQRNHLFEGAVVGGVPQHVNVPERMGRLVIGDNNTIRENATIHRALHEGNETVVGSGNQIMVNAHVAHDCQIGDDTIIVNNVMLAGHVTVENRAYLSGAVAVHQFVRIGRYAMVGGAARLVKDVAPYVTVDGGTTRVVGLNLIGLRRNGFSRDEIGELKAAYRLIYRSSLTWDEVLAQLAEKFAAGVAADFLRFFSGGTRGFTPERSIPRGATLKLADEPDGDRSLRVKAG